MVKFTERVFPMDEVAELYDSGLSLLAVAEKYNTTAGTIRNKLIKHGVEIRARGAHMISDLKKREFEEDLAALEEDVEEVEEEIEEVLEEVEQVVNILTEVESAAKRKIGW